MPSHGNFLRRPDIASRSTRKRHTHETHLFILAMYLECAADAGCDVFEHMQGARAPTQNMQRHLTFEIRLKTMEACWSAIFTHTAQLIFFYTHAADTSEATI